jgi:hypothetical protein
MISHFCSLGLCEGILNLNGVGFFGDGIVIVVEFLSLVWRVVMCQCSKLEISLTWSIPVEYPRVLWIVLYMVLASVASSWAVDDGDMAVFSDFNSVLRWAVGASDMMQRGNNFKSYAAFHFDTLVLG